MDLRSTRLPKTFVSLANRNFRWLWLGQLASSATFQMSSVAQGWLVYEITGSGFALGWVSAGWSLSSLLLSLFGGTICDRVEKRYLLMAVRLAMILNSIVLALLIYADAILIWHLAASSLFTGVLFAFMMPAQSAMLVELVDDDTLLNANSLNSVGMGLMGIFGASATGMLINTLGVGSVYLVMALLFVWSLYSLFRLPNTGYEETEGSSVWQDLVSGVQYIRSSYAIMVLLSIGLSRVLLAMPYRTLMPKYATDVLGYDATGLGVLLGAPGIGSTIASLIIASIGDTYNKATLLLWGGVLSGVSLILFVATGHLPIVLVALAAVGAFGQVCMITNQTLLQTVAGDTYRGRVMSVYMMMWGLTPLGTLPAGAIADNTGVRPVIMVQGILLAVILTYMLVRIPRIRTIDESTSVA